MNFRKHLQWAVIITVLANAAAMLSPIINSGDAVTYATIARHIALENDWVRLMLDGHDWLDKPHLPFWITALFFKIGGVSAFTYVLPGFIFHLIGAYYTYRLTRVLYNQHAAWLAVLMYLSTYNLMDASIEVKAETYLTGLIMPACYYWLRYDARFRLKYLFLGALFTGMAIMTKGIFTIVTISSGFVCSWLFQNQWRKLFSMKWLGALGLSLLFVAPELIALQLQFRQPIMGDGAVQPLSSFKFFFWDSQFGRFFNTGPIQNHNGHPLYFVLVFPWAFLPWTIVFFAALKAQLASFRAAEASERNAFVFLGGAFLCTFLMFSATKFQFDYYIDIILPFAAIFCARFVNTTTIGPALFVGQMGLAFLLVMLTIAIAAYVMNIGLAGATCAALIAMLYYFYVSRGLSANVKAVVYSVLTIDLVYLFLASMTALTFMKYSVPYNAERILGAQPMVPIYVYQMPEVARELALYSKASCRAINTVDALPPAGANFYLLVRRDQERDFEAKAPRFRQLDSMNLVVHKTGTFNKLLQLAKGSGPIERIDFLKSSPSP